MPDTFLAAHDVSVVYGAGAAAATALDNVSARFQPGEVALLMGASGSGKTTLLSILGCLRTPDRGHVTLLGRNLTGARDYELTALRRAHVGFVFQFFRLFRSLNALENVVMGLELAGNSRNQKCAAAEALDAVGLSSKRNLLPSEMSGGERQRVAIARALVKNPEILLADEPTAALDSASGHRVADLLRCAVKARGMVAVVATHDPRLTSIADRILEVRDGRLHEEGKMS